MAFLERLGNSLHVYKGHVFLAERLKAGVATKDWGPQALFDAEQSSFRVFQPWHLLAAHPSGQYQK